MNDDRQRLEQLLAELRSQLAASTTLDAAMRSRLEQTLGDVQQALSTPGGHSSPTAKPAAGISGTGISGAAPAAGPHAGEPLRKRLSEAAIDFEVSHPALANTLGSLIDCAGRDWDLGPPAPVRLERFRRRTFSAPVRPSITQHGRRRPGAPPVRAPESPAGRDVPDLGAGRAENVSTT